MFGKEMLTGIGLTAKEVLGEKVKEGAWNGIQKMLSTPASLKEQIDIGIVARGKLDAMRNGFQKSETEVCYEHLQSLRLILQEMLICKTDGTISLTIDESRLFWKICSRNGYSCRVQHDMNLDGTTTVILDPNGREFGLLIMNFEGKPLVRTLGW